MPASVASAPVNRTSQKTPASRAKKTAAGAKSQTAVNGTANGTTNGAVQHASPYGIMASRIANRVAEMAENYTFVEREKPSSPPAESTSKSQSQHRKPPRKLEMRLPLSGQSPTNITFSAPFLDNTLTKLLTLQNRMLKVSNDISASEDVEDSVKREQFNQSAELSRIIALICAEKARQGA
ncbi:hypothetical protein K458DRAFT_428489 [Lentithecium fluviatile CBS 122367]|uniref:Uncharacterized protein n=1 Tax=Lentithecium fluviatile CBS 122367 TaxID=1168545 RepID=A0A6G1JBX9_9PLEO|nr:hypothetical protein K458DRAFT_428489 [Lentithecium fluviatile CBS 122367]